MRGHIEYLLFPQARIWYCVLMIMEQSIPHSTRWASKSAGKLTCCGQLWQSWAANPSRPVGQRDNRVCVWWRERKRGRGGWRSQVCLEALLLSTSVQRETQRNTVFEWQLMLLIYRCLLAPRRKPLAHWSRPGCGMLHKTLEPAHNPAEPPLSWAEYKDRNMKNHE